MTLKVANIETLDFADLQEYTERVRCTVKVSSLDDAGWSLTDEATHDLLTKLRRIGKPLGEYVNKKIYYGVKTGLNEAFVIGEGTYSAFLADDRKNAELLRPFLAGKDVKRYQTPIVSKYLISIPNGWTRSNAPKGKDPWTWFQKTHPTIATHLEPFKEAASKRWDKGEYWWELRPCDYYTEFDRPKILWPEIAGNARFTFDSVSLYANNKVYLIPSTDMALLGMLNSALLRLFIESICTDLQGDSYNFSAIFVAKTPIWLPRPGNQEDAERRSLLSSLVSSIMDLSRIQSRAKTDHERIALQRQIDATDKQIDALVYELYGLTEDEIRIVEER
jgi:hypothetical protein